MITTIVHIGAEKGAASEVKELLGIDAKVLEGAIEFSCSKEQLFTYCYLSQAAIRVLLEDDPKLWLEDGMTFCVRSPNKQEEYDVGAELNKDNKYVVDLKNPDVQFYVFNGKTYIDYTGELPKRNYRVFTNQQSMKGTFAYSFLRTIGYTKEKSLLDPFAKDGTIPIEALHFQMRRSPRYFDWDYMRFTRSKHFKDIDFEDFFEEIEEKEQESPIYATSAEFKNVAALKKNLKISAIKGLDITRTNIEQLDQKFEENEIDLIATFLPRLNEKDFYQFCHQAHFIAKQTILLTEQHITVDNKYFSTEKEAKIQSGKGTFKIIWLKKKN